ncbi:hypothetical protein [Alienimonas californiensis]|uniref:Uncharacterized protein n=1 Tax=Alienimonas californiensis TaxID=2527989 RepID=A0A517P9C4_9PLAN|nr:hypothetical protein [Alienimonas californiensis]QDT15979.1 hypothetical protein CA12_20770 [Alienimonas californiensis]
MFAARLLFSLGLPLLIGCQPGDFRAETELNPDGSVTRTVQQKRLAGDADAWDEREDEVSLASARDWDRPLADVPPLPANRRARGEGGVRATGRFASADAMPHAVELPIASYSNIQKDAEVPPSRLERDVTVTDYGVLTAYEWEETLTAGTDPVRMERTRRFVLEESAPLVQAVLEQELGQGTDASALSEWVLTVGDDWTADLLAALLEAAARPGPLLNAPADRMREIARHYGLDAPDPRDDPKAAAAAGRAFARTLLAERVTVDGEPLAGAKLDRAMEVLMLNGSGPAGAAALWNGQLVVKYGSQQAGHDLAGVLTARFFGPNGLLGTGESFAYRHRTPGLLLETNGSILSAGDADGESAEVLFRFEIRDAWPFGRPMTARSVVLHPGRQREWFGEVLVGDRVAALQFLERMQYEHVRTEWLTAMEAGDAEAMRKIMK